MQSQSSSSCWHSPMSVRTPGIATISSSLVSFWPSSLFLWTGLYYLHQGDYVSPAVCLFVCLLANSRKIYWYQSFMKSLPEMSLDKEELWSNSGSHHFLDHKYPNIEKLLNFAAVLTVYNCKWQYTASWCKDRVIVRRKITHIAFNMYAHYLVRTKKRLHLCISGLTRIQHVIWEATVRNKINLTVRRTRWAKTNQQSTNTHTRNTCTIIQPCLETATMATCVFCTTTSYTDIGL